MPNWVINRVRCSAENWNQLQEIMLTNEEDTNPSVDFNRILPIPDVIPADHPLNSHTPLSYADTSNRWHIEHWGTKWNACDTEIDDAHYEIAFQTAWSHPYQVIRSLSEQLEGALLVLYADEDHGDNLGGYAIHNGTMTFECDIPDAHEAADPAFPMNMASLIRYGRCMHDVWIEYYDVDPQDDILKSPLLREEYDVWERVGLTFDAAVHVEHTPEIKAEKADEKATSEAREKRTLREKVQDFALVIVSLISGKRPKK